MNFGVFGGMGYIGSRLVSKLAKTHKVKIFDKMMYDVSDEFASKVITDENIALCKFDIQDGDMVRHFINRCDKIVNLSAYVGETICKSDPIQAVGTNEYGAILISDICNELNKHMIFLSTCSNYGISQVLCDEDSELNPITLYAKTKVSAENNISKTNPFSTILRMSTVFGVSDSRTRMDIIPNQFVKEAMIKHKISVYEPNAYRPIIHVDDATNIIQAVLETDRPKHRIYNVGFSSLNITKAEMIEYVKNQIFCDVEVVKNNDNRSYKVDFSRLHEEFDLIQHYGLERGVDEVVSALNSDELDLSCGNYAYNKEIA